MIDLDKEKYFVIDELIDKKTADLFANYFIVKKNVAQKKTSIQKQLLIQVMFLRVR